MRGTRRHKFPRSQYWYRASSRNAEYCRGTLNIAESWAGAAFLYSLLAGLTSGELGVSSAGGEMTGSGISSSDLNIPNSHHLMTSLSWHHDISEDSISVQFSLCIIYWILGGGWYVRGWSCYTVMGVSGPVTRNSSPCHVTPSRTLNKYFTPITITQS